MFGISAVGANINHDFWQILSPYMIAGFLGYFIAQLAKMVICSIKKRKLSWRDFFKSGSMPSSHSAVVTALATTIGLSEGFGTPIFALSAWFAIIVIYDATHVRRATGDQGEAINELIDKTGEKVKKPYFSRGHTPLEATVGSVLGVAIGFIVMLCI
jgi:acid phosphatase family membrane protein YuiD